VILAGVLLLLPACDAGIVFVHDYKQFLVSVPQRWQSVDNLAVGRALPSRAHFVLRLDDVNAAGPWQYLKRFGRCV
jgi:hypothetical protein